MLRILFLIFVGVPTLEIILLIQIGGWIGTGYTLLTVVATALLGAVLVRGEGIRTLIALQERMGRGELPGRELADGAMLLVAGALLVTPGFFTDAVGFLLIFPWSRAWLRWRLLKILAAKIHDAAGGVSIGGMDGVFRQNS